MALVAVLVESEEDIGLVTRAEDFAAAHADLKDGRPAGDGGGIVMKVMTSCSLRPARRARKPPMAWIPSCELPRCG